MRSAIQLLLLYMGTSLHGVLHAMEPAQTFSDEAHKILIISLIEKHQLYEIRPALQKNYQESGNIATALKDTTWAIIGDTAKKWSNRISSTAEPNLLYRQLKNNILRQSYTLTAQLRRELETNPSCLVAWCDPQKILTVLLANAEFAQCPACEGHYSDSIPLASGGRRITLPCTHSVCTHCFQGLGCKTCSLCQRKPIEQRVHVSNLLYKAEAPEFVIDAFSETCITSGYKKALKNLEATACSRVEAAAAGLKLRCPQDKNECKKQITTNYCTFISEFLRTKDGDDYAVVPLFNTEHLRSKLTKDTLFELAVYKACTESIIDRAMTKARVAHLWRTDFVESIRCQKAANHAKKKQSRQRKKEIREQKYLNQMILNAPR
jgi:hypothetical protein